jgi:homoserine O-acetyltransferase
MSLNDAAREPVASSWPAAEAPDLREDAGRDAFALTLPLRHAGARRVTLRYEWRGPEDAPLVVVAGGISAGRHVGASARYPEPGWWPQQAGVGQALDSERFRLLAIDWLGADGSLDAPIDSADQADAIAAVLARIGQRRVAAFVGCSYGAMVGLQFAARHGERLGALVAISGGAGAHPYASAWRSLQRRILELGRSEGGTREALSLARQLALLSYRTPEEFAERFAAPATLADGRVRVAAEDWLQARGAHYVARTAPTAFARLSESIDLHALEPQEVRVPTVLVAVEEDRLVPRADLVALAEALPCARRLHLLRSRFGHDAFLTEHAAIAAILREALAECRP